jgi:hypothetical protein
MIEFLNGDELRYALPRQVTQSVGLPWIVARVRDPKPPFQRSFP